MPNLAGKILPYIKGLGGRAMGAGAYGIGAMGGRLGAMALSPFAYRGSIGALAGGIYGAASDDTSILGGAAMGFGIARYGGAAGRFALRAGLSPAANISGFGNLMARSGRVAFATAFRDGQVTRRFIGNTAGRAYGRIRGLFNV